MNIDINKASKNAPVIIRIFFFSIFLLYFLRQLWGFAWKSVKVVKTNYRDLNAPFQAFILLVSGMLLKYNEFLRT